MDSEEFFKTFCFNDQEFAGYVTIGNKNSLSTFIICYAPASDDSIEKTIEINPIIKSDSETLE